MHDHTRAASIVFMAFLLETIRLGLSNLRLHMLRSVLTSLGIILGVAAVILMVAIGEGNKRAAIRDIQALGARNIIVRSQRPPESSSVGTERRSFVAQFGLEDFDWNRLEQAVSDAAHMVPLKAFGAEISRGSKRTTSQVFGTTPELLEVLNLDVAPGGRYLVPEDQDGSSRVAVIGSAVADQFFPLDDPLGASIRIDDRIFQVVGVLEPVGLAGGAGVALVGRDLNLDVHIPITTGRMEFSDTVYRRVSGSFSGEETRFSEIYIEAPDSEHVLQMSERVRRVIAVGHDSSGDVAIIVPWELLANVERTTFAMNLLLTAIAAISLLVGGIGIMNIMLASVVERTREIGIRRALGATRRHVIAQFLVETGTLSAAGGILGIFFGVGLSLAVDRILPWVLALPIVQRHIETEISFEAAITPWSVVVSFTVAAATGIIFGIYPAIMASRQDPIQALRHE
ncbi:MAG: ABC transporter permease [Phycisphaerae bacterium]|jgi:putative ABC transport system permease protein|nr:ABC transporter permease [Phycisphaerae bacterium]MBT5381620.1 ABC transporter permease [Phycisphaerae bacterium]MBT5657580.1 ABC transporter permease [Phycisphaerae bacterium]